MACDAPISIRFNPPRPDGKGGLIYYFPGDCGRCLNCLRKRKAAWCFRMMAEKMKAFSSYFVTLTYDEKHLPRTDTGNSINKNDHHEFINTLKFLESEKRLSDRKQISIEESERKKRGVKEFGKLKYYGVYEYGGVTGRCHAHYIIYNIRDTANIINAWGKGVVDIDPDVNENNIDYVLKYMLKNHKTETNEERQKEVSFMSKGIGESAVDDGFLSYIRKEDNTQVCSPRGAKIAIPRYYRRKYLDDSQRIKKSAYIARSIFENDARKERENKRIGVDISKLELRGKEARLDVLNNQKKRNL